MAVSRFKILEIGAYPPPFSGWSVRIKYLRDAFRKAGDECIVVNLGKNRKIKSPDYLDVQNGLHYLKTLLSMRLKGYHFHIHVNAQAVKGPILGLMAHLVSLLSFQRAALTFHGGMEQLYFPKRHSGKMYLVIWLNFFLPKVVICNDEAIKKAISEYGPMIDSNRIHPIPAFSKQYLQGESQTLPSKLDQFIRGKKSLVVSYIVLRDGFYIETLLEFLNALREDVGVVLTGLGEVEDDGISGLYRDLLALEARGRVLLSKSLDHNVFLKLLMRADVYLRTPTSDGVASSVLEALSLGTPVVASENGRRPKGVLCYSATDAGAMQAKVEQVLKNIGKTQKALQRPVAKDTIKTEVALLKRVFFA